MTKRRRSGSVSGGETGAETDSRERNGSQPQRGPQGGRRINGSSSRPVALRRVRRTTNPMKSAFFERSHRCQNLKRWRAGDPLERWIGSALILRQQHVRRIVGCKAMPKWVAILQAYTGHRRASANLPSLDRGESGRSGAGRSGSWSRVSAAGISPESGKLEKTGPQNGPEKRAQMRRVRLLRVRLRVRFSYVADFAGGLCAAV